MYRCREIYLIPITDISITIEYLENIYILNSGVPDSNGPPPYQNPLKWLKSTLPTTRINIRSRFWTDNTHRKPSNSDNFSDNNNTADWQPSIKRFWPLKYLPWLTFKNTMPYSKQHTLCQTYWLTGICYWCNICVNLERHKYCTHYETWKRHKYFTHFVWCHWRYVGSLEGLQN